MLRISPAEFVGQVEQIVQNVYILLGLNLIGEGRRSRLIGVVLTVYQDDLVCELFIQRERISNVYIHVEEDQSTSFS